MSIVWHIVRVHYSLFWVISRICENPGIDPTLNSINALDDNSIGTSVDKIIIEYYIPHAVHELAAAMGDNGLSLRPPFAMKG